MNIKLIIVILSCLLATSGYYNYVNYNSAANASDLETQLIVTQNELKALKMLLAEQEQKEIKDKAEWQAITKPKNVTNKTNGPNINSFP